MSKNIPNELKELRQWVVWKRDKVPYSARTGRPASPTDPNTWTDYTAAVRALQKEDAYCGVGFVFTADDPYIGIDIDDCASSTGKIRPFVQEIISKLDSYTEYSPSGTGIHIILRGKKPGPRCRKKHHACTVEIYEKDRYFTVTGNHVPGTPEGIRPRSAELAEIYRELFGDTEPAGSRHEAPASSSPLTDEEIIEKACDAVNGAEFELLWKGEWERSPRDYPSHSEADLAFCTMLSFYTGRDPERIDRVFRQSGLYRKKWDRPDYSGGVIVKALEGMTEFHDDVVLEGRTENTGDAAPAPLTPEQAPDRSDREEFPAWVMGEGLAGDFARLYGAHLEAPMEFFYMAFLTCLGTLLSGRLTLASEIRPQPRLYTLLLGESADDKKSTAIKKTVHFFTRCERERLAVCWGTGSAEGLQKELQKKERLLLCVDEFKAFLQKCRIETSVLLPCINTLFESNSYENATRKSHVRVHRCYLSMLAASTVETYERIWNPAFTAIGFNNRLWLVTGRRTKRIALPQKIPEEALDALRVRTEGVLLLVGERMELPMSDGGRRLYEEWYLRLQGRSVHAKRLDTYALRLMTLLAVVRMHREVDATTVRQAIDLVEWQLRVRQRHDPIDADNGSARMEQNIRRQLRRKPMTESKIKQYTNAHRAGLWIFNSALRNLLRAGEIERDPGGKKWRLTQTDEE